MKLQEAKTIFLEFLKNNKNKQFAVSTHARADIDSLASAYALSSVIKDSVLVVPDEINDSAKKLAEKLHIGYQLIKNVKKEKFSGLIVVDTGAYVLLKDAKEWDIILIVDHHRKEGRDMKAKHEIFVEESPSCCEIIANIIDEKDISKESAFALACGIVSDTARFKAGRKETFETLVRLMDIANASYPEILDMAESELAQDTKIAVIKALQRIEYITAGEYIIATSEISANESDVSSAISEIADVAFVASWKPKENVCNVSARARKHVKVALHEVMKNVAMQYNGNGGGHPKAAGAAIPNKSTKEVLKMCIEMFMNKLK